MINAFKTLTNGIFEYAKILKGDWNENDSSSPYYIKNRPFYVDNEETIFSVKDAEFVSIASDASTYTAAPTIEPYIHELTSTINLEVDKEYTVVWDGVEYICKCKDIIKVMEQATYDAASEPVPFLGNLYYITAESIFDTGEPFCIVPAEYMIFTISTASTHDIDIKYEKVVKIPSKFLEVDISKNIPDNIATKDDVDAVEFYVNDQLSYVNGQLSDVEQILSGVEQILASI